MTFEEKRKIYEEMQLYYRIEDAHRHVEDMISSGVPYYLAAHELSDSDIERIAKAFIDNYDCDIDENSQWENTILDMIDTECPQNAENSKSRYVYKQYADDCAKENKEPMPFEDFLESDTIFDYEKYYTEQE